MVNGNLSPGRVLLPAAIGTCLSLMGDASLYTVLPTQTAAAGVSVASVGILLSANRFIRLVLNGPAGMAYDRWRRRPLFVSALFIGAFSTAIYGLTEGFWPLLLGRLLWGLAWAGIWIGGHTMVLDIANDGNRGRWVGIYQLSFFLGASGGALLGGLLTDTVGYHQAMVINAALTLVGVVVALIFLPETRGLKQGAADSHPLPAALASNPAEKVEFTSAAALYAVNRLAMTGFLQCTLGFFFARTTGRAGSGCRSRVGRSHVDGAGPGSVHPDCHDLLPAYGGNLGPGGEPLAGGGRGSAAGRGRFWPAGNRYALYHAAGHSTGGRHQRQQYRLVHRVGWRFGQQRPAESPSGRPVHRGRSGGRHWPAAGLCADAVHRPQKPLLVERRYFCRHVPGDLAARRPPSKKHEHFNFCDS